VREYRLSDVSAESTYRASILSGDFSRIIPISQEFFIPQEFFKELKTVKLQIQKIVVCGGGGFIGGHLVKTLLANGAAVVRSIDIKPRNEWYQEFSEAENLVLDLQKKEACQTAVKDADVVFNLAADMGGMGFIENNKALCMLSVLINTHLLLASRNAGVKRFFFASSACVYNADKQRDARVTPLKEEDAYPALPEDGYGWEKLFSERMCRHFEEDFGLQCRVARFHNVYGPNGTYEGGREKAPAAICRKVIEAIVTGKQEIEIWGDGKQTRSFMYIDDCVKGVQMLTESDIHEPLNLGSAELVTINELVDIVEEIAGVKLKRNYKFDAPRGVNGRNSDNTRIRRYLGWEPSVALKDGLAETYLWIENEMLPHLPRRSSSKVSAVSSRLSTIAT
jgi:nucleoside-diphosphate-sugar epimerase